jgi:Uma2 family endonuclease
MAILVENIELPADRSAIPSVPIWRFTVAQYHEMARAGILTEDDPVELLNGWVVVKMTKNPPHSVTTGLVRVALERIVPQGWCVDPQEPITLSASEPEPDVTVIRGHRRDYLDRHPNAAEVGLVVEVADASLDRDQVFKKSLYAEAGIAVYWVVNLVERRVEVYTEPSGPGRSPDYRSRRDYAPSDEMPLLLDAREVGRIPVRDLLP